MNRINARQFAAMLLIGDVFSLLCLGGEITLLSVFGFAAAAVTGVGIFLPFAMYYRSGCKLGVIAELILLGCIIIWIFK